MALGGEWNGTPRRGVPDVGHPFFWEFLVTCPPGTALGEGPCPIYPSSIPTGSSAQGGLPRTAGWAKPVARAKGPPQGCAGPRGH